MTVPVLAQVNTERMRLERPAFGLSGETRADAEFHSGNIDFLQVGVRGRLDYDDSLWLAFIIGNYQLRRKSHDVFDRSAFVHARYNRTIAPLLVLEVFAQQEYNKSLQLKNRSLAGCGVRIPVVRSEDLYAFLGTAWMYEYEERSIGASDPAPPIRKAQRWSSYAIVRYLGVPHLQCMNTVYVQPRFDRWSDIRILDEGLLLFEISKRFGVTNTLSLRFDHEPPEGVKQTDVTFCAGVLFSF
jgi:hypothetical protein